MTIPVTTCYRHADRRAGVSCQRCGRPICANCMTQASVGFQCPECAKSGRQKVYDADTIRSLNRPWVTYVLIAVNAAVLVVDMATRTTMVESLPELGGIIANARYDDGSLAGVANGEWYRIITGGFLHANVVHLGMNMLVLYLIGSQLEAEIGRWKFLGLYMTSLFAGSLAVLAFNPDSLTVGASGAVYGLFGVVFVYQRSLGIDPWRSGIGGLIVVNLVFSFAFPNISIAGHLGGLVGGGLVALAVFGMERKLESQLASLGLCAAISAVLFVLTIAVAQNPIV